jgi:hypothetical protein
MKYKNVFCYYHGNPANDVDFTILKIAWNQVSKALAEDSPLNKEKRMHPQLVNRLVYRKKEVLRACS